MLLGGCWLVVVGCGLWVMDCRFGGQKLVDS